ncbi:methyl-accepting chemotaxis protein [Echinimonas agarilytica]|uniref:Methyl-accepting chemotaxis protein n=1 Tax=Echinimonas agarilytica TaxID=1215918 RepID=A0AA42B6J7_9GAMM|nr:methyl-accepting chemotaxis protein [Echinimonas agarilytica]MCM2678521.1 methyl-accepting chemotaxis protein [Echinimonas agarilytica]
MKFLNQINIKTRIVVLALLPIFVIGFLTLNQYRKANIELDRIEQLNTVMDLSRQAGLLMDAIQDERDLSNGFLAKESNIGGPIGEEFGSTGNDFKAPLVEQRRAVDQQIRAFEQYVQAREQDYQVLPTVQAALTQLNRNLDNMINVRDKIDRYMMRDGNTWTLVVYDNTSDQFFRLFEAIVRIASSDPELSLMSNAYMALVTLGERYSVERGVVARASFMKGLDYNIYARVKTTRQEIDNTVSRFNAFAGRQMVESFRQQHLESATNRSVFEDWKIYRSSAGKKLPFEALTWYPRSTANIDSLNRFKNNYADQIIVKSSELEAQAKSAVMLSLVMFFGVCIAIGTVSYFMIVSILRPLKKLVNELSHIAQHKDLSYNVSVVGNDELSDVARAADSLLASFKVALTGVLEVEVKMKDLTSQVLESMNISQQRTENQNRTTDGVSVAMNEMTASVSEVSVSAQSTSDAVQRLYQMSVSSSESANTSKEIMEQLTSDVSEATSMVESVNEESNSIGAVINVIQGIAEQTNLLALNAAIEAARAGEQGRGFAVVADEVRGLASRTQESTSHIQQQIESLQKRANQVTSTMDKLKSQGNQAVEVVVEALDSFAVFQKELDMISQMSTQIATAAEEQTLTSSDINRQVHEIKLDSDEMTVHTQATQKASHELAQSAEVLDSHVAEFKVAH